MAINLPIVSTFDGKGVTGAIAGIQNLGAKLLGFGALVAGAFVVREVIQFGRSAIEAAEGVQVANDRLRAVADATQVFGAETAKVTGRLIEFAEAQEMVIGQDAEVIKGVQATLLSFKDLSKSAGEVGGNFDRATKAAFDMGAVLQKDAASQAMALAKALEDPVKGVTALRKAGTLFTEQQREQIKTMVESGNLLGAQNLILAEVESQYGGAAEATATWSQKFALAVDNVKEAAGKSLLPIFEQFAEFMVTEVFPPVTKFFEEDFPGILDALMPIVTDVVEGFTEIGDAIKDFLDIPADVSLLEGLLDTLGSVKDNPTFQGYVEAVRDAIADMAPDAKDAVIELGNLATAMKPAVTDAFKDGAGAIGDVLSILTNLSSIIRVLTGQDMAEVDTAVEKNEASWTRLIPVIGSYLGEDGILAQVASAFEFMADKISEQAPQFELFWDSMRLMVETGSANILAAIQGTFATMGTVFSNAFAMILEQVGIWLTNWNMAIINTPLYQTALTVMTNFWTGLQEMWTVIYGWLTLKPEEIRASFGNAGELLLQVGKDIINGLWNGLKAAWVAVEKWVKEKVQWIIDSFKRALKIGSPSKVFYEFGENIVQGLVGGLDSEAPKVDVAMSDLAAMPSASFAGNGGGMAGAGSVYNITVNAGIGSDPVRVGEYVVSAIKRYERASGRVFASA